VIDKRIKALALYSHNLLARLQTTSTHYPVVRILSSLHEKCISFVVLRYRPMGTSLDMLFSVYWQHRYPVRSLSTRTDDAAWFQRPHKYHCPATSGAVYFSEWLSVDVLATRNCAIETPNSIPGQALPVMAWLNSTREFIEILGAAEIQQDQWASFQCR
jgi:hypothetical protein